MRKLILIVALSIFVIGCAATPKGAATFEQAEVAKPDNERAVLVLYRKVVPPLLFSVTSSINGSPHATLPNRAFTWSYLSPGEHNIKIKWPVLALTPGKEINLKVEAGKYYFVEFGGSMQYAGVGSVFYGVYGLNQPGYEQGISEVKACCNYVPSNF